MSQIRYTKCSKFVIPNVPNIRITKYNTKVSDLVSNGLNDRSNRMQSSMLELLRCSR